jgi:protein-S-isoprenylcysteine O-methyltransferase Ste14
VKSKQSEVMKKVITITCGVIAHLAFLVSFVYLIGFIGDFLVPKTINSGVVHSFWESVSINLSLIALFGLQHSIMARPGFKRWLTGIIPEHFERSLYVIQTSIPLVLLFWFWQPLPEIVWHVETEWLQWVLWGLFALGWIVVIVSAESISGANFLGRRQLRDYLKGWEPRTPDFKVVGLYKLVRHPMMLGFLLAFWSIPTMTTGHLLFASGMTGYILVALPIEERDMIRFFGVRYRMYKKYVRMLIPIPKRTPDTD